MTRWCQLLNCDNCGRFMTREPGSSYAMRYSGYPPTPDHEQTRCKPCTEAHGALRASTGIAEWTAGIVAEEQCR